MPISESHLPTLASIGAAADTTILESSKICVNIFKDFSLYVYAEVLQPVSQGKSWT